MMWWSKNKPTSEVEYRGNMTESEIAEIRSLANRYRTLCPDELAQQPFCVEALISVVLFVLSQRAKEK